MKCRIYHYKDTILQHCNFQCLLHFIGGIVISLHVHIVFIMLLPFQHATRIYCMLKVKPTFLLPFYVCGGNRYKPTHGLREINIIALVALMLANMIIHPDNKGHGANNGTHLGPTGPRWARVGPMNFAIWTHTRQCTWYLSKGWGPVFQ